MKIRKASKSLFWILVFSLLVGLTGCSDDEEGFNGSGAEDTSDNEAPSNNTGDGDNSAPVNMHPDKAYLGYLSIDPETKATVFEAGLIHSSHGSEFAANTEVQLVAHAAVSKDGVIELLDEAELDVKFSSLCHQLGHAEINPTTESDFAARSEVTYRANSQCTFDRVTVATSKSEIDSIDLELDILLPAPHNIAFYGFGGLEDGERPLLRLKGIYSNEVLPETQAVSFQLQDVSGHPVTGRKLEFELQYTAIKPGELEEADKPYFVDFVTAEAVDTPTAMTDSKGRVTVYVASGHEPMLFQVLASLKDSDIKVLSPSLATSSGLPNEQFFRIFKEYVEVDEDEEDGSSGDTARDYIIRVTAGDILGNPVPDGVRIRFSSNKGVVESECITGTANPGQCEVTWWGDLSDGDVSISAYTFGFAKEKVSRTITFNVE